MHWCWWLPGKLESIHYQMDNVLCTVLLKYTYMPVLGLISKCLLSVVCLSAVLNLQYQVPHCGCVPSLIMHFVQTYSTCWNTIARKRLYWIHVMLEVYFQSMTEIKWHAPSAVICYIWVGRGGGVLPPLSRFGDRIRSLH